MAQSVTSNILIDAFDILGGNSSDAVRHGRKVGFLDDWKAWQITQVAVVGAAASAIPVAHLATMTADVAILLHKMAFAAWGVGGVLDVPVNGKSDLSLILAMWSKSISRVDLEKCMEFAAGTVAVTAGTYFGTTLALAHPHQAAVFGGKMVDMTISIIADDLPIHGLGPLGQPAGAIAQKYMEKALSKAHMMAPQLMHKFGAKIAAVISSNAGQKFLHGFIPIVGAVLVAYINGKIINDIIDEAEFFYRAKKRKLQGQ